MAEACAIMRDAINICLHETEENLRDHLQDLDMGGGVCVCVCVLVCTCMYHHDTAAPSGPWPAYCRGFMSTLRNITLDRNPLGE